MRGEIEGPGRIPGKTEYGAEHAPYKFGVVKQVKRTGRIAHIRCGRTAVRETFLGNKYYLPLFVGY
jgi:hypothetical protein